MQKKKKEGGEGRADAHELSCWTECPPRAVHPGQRMCSKSLYTRLYSQDEKEKLYAQRRRVHTARHTNKEESTSESEKGGVNK